MKPYLLVLFLLLLVTGAFAASAQPAQLVALACFGVAQFQNCPSGGRPITSSGRRTATFTA